MLAKIRDAVAVRSKCCFIIIIIIGKEFGARGDMTSLLSTGLRSGNGSNPFACDLHRERGSSIRI